MNDNQTIDGVPRELRALLERIVEEPRDVDAQVSRQAAVDELRALLDAPAKLDLVECDACPTSGGCVSVCMKAPKPAAQPQPVARVEIGADRNAALTVTNDDWLRSLKDRGVHQIVSLYAEQPAPVAVALPARPRADEEEYERMTDYEKGLLHGSIELWDKIDELKRLNPSL